VNNAQLDCHGCGKLWKKISFRLGRPVIDGLTSEQSRVKPSTLRFITVPERLGIVASLL